MLPASESIFLAVLALLFIASAAATIVWCASMPDMGAVPMPGGWVMSMAWMPMCGQTWFGATASFTAMWLVMMVAMMLPSLSPVLLRYHRIVADIGESRRAVLMLVAGLGYFSVWAIIGAALFLSGAVLAEALLVHAALAQAVPLTAGITVLGAGLLQFSKWKLRHLAGFCAFPDRGVPADAAAAWRYGLRLGLHCSYASAGLKAILLVIGVMDLLAMTLAMAAITAERLALARTSAGRQVVQVIGIAAIGAGLILVLRAVASA